MLCRQTQQLSTVDKHTRQFGVATQEKYYVIALPSWECFKMSKSFYITKHFFK